MASSAHQEARMKILVWLWVGALLVVVSILAVSGALPGRVEFQPFDLALFLKSLAPLLVIALLIERTVAVLFGIWPEEERTARASRWAFLAGGTLGVLVSVAGVRLVETLLAPGSGTGRLFRATDVLLTGGLLGGGADGFRQLAKVLRAFLEAGRAKAEAIKRRAQAAPQSMA
jgi:hypothetical protein